MQRYPRGMVPYMRTAPEQAAPSGGQGPLEAAVLLGETVRAEHGREGVRIYIRALSPLIPRQLLEQAAKNLGEEPPPPEPPWQPEKARQPEPAAVREPPRERGGIKPEQLLQLMQGMKKGEGGGLDPMMLLNLMKGAGD